MCFSAYWWIDLVSVLPDYVALVLATAAGCRLDRWLRTLRRGRFRQRSRSLPPGTSSTAALCCSARLRLKASEARVELGYL